MLAAADFLSSSGALIMMALHEELQGKLQVNAKLQGSSLPDPGTSIQSTSTSELRLEQ